MKFRFYYLTFLLVVIIPVALVIFGFKWELTDLGRWGIFEYITNTGDGLIGVGVTSLVLVGIIYYFYRHNFLLFVSLAAYAFFALGATQLVKYALKNTFKESRPYVVQMMDKVHQIDQDEFLHSLQLTYNIKMGVEFQDLDTKEQDTGAKPNADGSIPTETAKAEQVLPNQQFLCKGCDVGQLEDMYYHRLTKEEKEFFTTYFADYFYRDNPAAHKQLLNLSAETGYSLPSGHSMFASVWMFIFGILAFSARKLSLALTSTVVFAWGFLLQESRIVLGYHYTHDVLFSAIIGSLFVWVTFRFAYILYRILFNLTNKEQQV